MKIIAFLIFSGLPLLLLAQSKNYQEAIDQQVWKPFVESYNTRDTEARSKVHSEDFIRVLRDSKEIFGFNQAFAKHPDSLLQRWAQWKSSLELRFTERIASEDKAFEIGYYKSSSTHIPTGEQRTSYGKFHVLLRKENGVWKILMDADAHENIDETIFQSAEPLKLNK